MFSFVHCRLPARSVTRTRPLHRRPAVEALEQRTLLSTDFLYWSTAGELPGGSVNSTIKRAHLDGTGVETLLAHPVSGRFGAIAFDEAHGYLYSADGQIIFRANLDGSGRVNLLTSPGYVGDLELDLVHGKIYWGLAAVYPTALYSANLDGSGLKMLYSHSGGNVEGIAVDPVRGKLYFTDELTGIRVSNLDGSNQAVFQATPHPFDLEIDPVNGKLYWDDFSVQSNQRIQRASLDGSGGIETIYATSDVISNGIHFDPVHQQLYFASTQVGSAAPVDMNRIAADGTGHEVLLRDLGRINYMEVVHGVATPDITPTSPTWDTAQGGVDFGYKVSGAALPKDTTAALYWSSSDKFADAIGGPIPGTTEDVPVGTVAGTYGPFHIDAATLGAPPPGATHLLAVTDPNNLLGNFDASKNVISLAYDPKVTVIAKYDGDPRDPFMGRYFAGTDALKDNFYTIKVSDSLDALRPVVQVTVGGQTLDATPSPATADTFVTTAFDPGSLPTGDVQLTGTALIQGNDVADFSATVLVEPIPDWAKSLRDFNVTFDPNGDGPGGAGAYVFDGMLPNLSLGGSVFTVPGDVPLIGGQALQYSVGFEVKTVAPLAVSSAPTVEGGLQANLTLGSFATLPVVFLPPTTRLDNDKWTFTVTPGAALDAVTLNEPNEFALTLALDGKVPTPLEWEYDKVFPVFPFGIPVLLDFSVKASLDVMVHAHAQVVYDSAGLEFLAGGTYLGLGIEGSVEGSAKAGWFAPGWVQNFLNLRFGHTFKPPTLALQDTATIALTFDVEAHFSGPATPLPTYSGLLFKGGAKFSDKLELLFQIGDFTLIDLVIADLTKKSPDYSWSLP
jgi:hypothetical protein